MTAMSNRMNEIVKVLTIIGTIFIPLTFLAGVYGMNFHQLPELEWRWGYPLFWVGSARIAGGMIAWVCARGGRWLVRARFYFLFCRTLFGTLTGARAVVC